MFQPLCLVLTRALFTSSLMPQWRRCRLCSKTFCEGLEESRTLDAGQERTESSRKGL